MISKSDEASKVWAQGERGRLHTGWQALLAAARASHKPGPGGSRICICGAACGGSEACGMLGALRDLVRYIPAEGLPEEWRHRIDELKRVM